MSFPEKALDSTPRTIKGRGQSFLKSVDNPRKQEQDGQAGECPGFTSGSERHHSGVRGRVS